MGQDVGALVAKAAAVLLILVIVSVSCFLQPAEAWARSGSVPFTASNPEMPQDAKDDDVSSSSSSTTSTAATGVKTSSPVFFSYLPNPTTEAFIESICEDARDIGQKRGLYASVMIAQAILESGSGSSGLSKPPYNNLFGIKGSYHGRSVTMGTSEDDGSGAKYDISAAFRSYPDVRASLDDYANLLTVQMAAFYAPVRKANAKTYKQACDYLQGHYATDTTYSAKLQALISAYELDEYDYPKGVSPDRSGKDGDAVFEVNRFQLAASGAHASSSHNVSVRSSAMAVPWTVSWAMVALFAIALPLVLFLCWRLVAASRKGVDGAGGSSRG